MQVPLEIRFHDVDRSDWSENFIQRQVERLERYVDDIISCRVTVSRPHRRQRTGQPYQVMVEVTLPPQHVLAATAEPVEVPGSAELRNVIRDAFRAMERQLIRIKELREGTVKQSEEARALVFKLLPEEGYGFLKSPEGEEIYFHRNALVNGGFEHLAVGDRVRFAESEGVKGPQASTVHLVKGAAQA